MLKASKYEASHKIRFLRVVVDYDVDRMQVYRVQNVVRQFGLYLSWAHEICVALTLVREDRVGLTSGLPVVPPGALPGI